MLYLCTSPRDECWFMCVCVAEKDANVASALFACFGALAQASSVILTPRTNIDTWDGGANSAQDMCRLIGQSVALGHV